MLGIMTVDAEPLAQSVVVAYGSTFGTTEKIARQIADALAVRTGRRPTLADVAWTGMPEIVQHDVLILGSSTWGEGELQPAWDVALDALSASDLRGRRVAVFGCGDRAGYPDTFDATKVRDGDDLVGLIVDDGEDDDARVAHVAWWCDLLTSEWRHAP